MNHHVPVKYKDRTDLFATVDECDYATMSRHKWYLMPAGYAARYQGCGRPMALMHREILGTPKGRFVDHKNGNKLDNQRSNLRECSKSQNGFNRQKKPDWKERNAAVRSQYRGVCYISDSPIRPWRARIGVNGRGIYLGHFTLEKDAARAYDKAAMEFHGSFAALNFP